MSKMQQLIVAGGGPAGLTAAYEATRHGITPLVFEKDKVVGGIARTECHEGFRFDMGGHRFFTKSEEVNQMWHEVLTDDFLLRPRLSRIYYQQKFFAYPLKPFNALRGLGLYESAFLMASYCRWKVFPHPKEESFEEWVINRFGRRLFRTFFKSYTEKVWGISTSELKAEWAAQRIKDLSLKRAIVAAIFKPTPGKIKTLIEEFHYPRKGPGMLWEAVAKAVETAGGEVRMQTGVTKIHRDGMKVTGVTVSRQADAGPAQEHVPCENFITSMPLTQFVRQLDPPAPQPVLDAADGLKYRDFLTVCVVVDEPDLFPDNWIYVHDPSVQVGRIQNFGNWSPEMLPEEARGKFTSLGLEYFCNEGEDLWNTPDEELVKLAREELARIGLVPADKVGRGVVYRVPKSYPVYDSGYEKHLKTIRDFVDGFENCRTIGRNGLHRYNNQDHSMLTGMYAVRDLILGETHDLWEVNADKSYHEEDREPKSSAGAKSEGRTKAKKTEGRPEAVASA